VIYTIDSQKGKFVYIGHMHVIMDTLYLAHRKVSNP
jgi:hypothetical protein